MSTENKLNQSAIMKERWKSQEWRTMMITKLKERWNNPEFKKNVSLKIKKAHTENPTNYWLGKRRESMIGEKNWRWNGGKSPLNSVIRESIEGRAWKRKVLTRDNYSCQGCGIKEKLVVHHLLSFSEFPEFRFEEWNGQVLCKICHVNLHKPRKLLKGTKTKGLS